MKSGMNHTSDSTIGESCESRIGGSKPSVFICPWTGDRIGAVAQKSILPLSRLSMIQNSLYKIPIFDFLNQVCTGEEQSWFKGSFLKALQIIIFEFRNQVRVFKFYSNSGTTGLWPCIQLQSTYVTNGIT